MLPKTDNLALKATIIAVCAGLMYLFCLSASAGELQALILAAVVFLPCAAGLWMLKEIARKLVCAVIWLFILIAPPGLINPFMAMDRYGHNPPEAWQLALAIYPFVALGLAIVHLLEKHKTEFSPLFHKHIDCE